MLSRDGPCSAGRRAITGLAESVIESMSSDHKSAANHRDRHFVCVRRQSVSEPGRSCDAGKTTHHQYQNRRATVSSKADHQGNRSEERNQYSETAMDPFLSRQEVRHYSRRRDQHGRKKTMDDTQGGGPDPHPVRPFP
jgi:hypothetical protein